MAFCLLFYFDVRYSGFDIRYWSAIFNCSSYSGRPRRFSGGPKFILDACLLVSPHLQVLDVVGGGLTLCLSNFVLQVGVEKELINLNPELKFRPHHTLECKIHYARTAR